MVKSDVLELADAVTRAGSSAIRDLLELTEQPHVLSLAGGLPHAASFPVDAIARAAAATLADDPTAALQYGPTEGHRPLRAWAAARLGSTTERIIITSGSQQALDLLARSLIDPGRVVALADPAYVGALQAFRAAGASLAAIETDHHGLRVDDLATRLAAGLRPVAVYVVSNFDNPSGATLSEPRRRALAALADRYGFWIIDDDPYGELRWDGEAPPPLRSMSDRVITLGSTSKVLCPGLRVGWADAPPAIHRATATVKQASDLHTSSLAQQIVHRVLTEPGMLPAHLATLRTTYRAQADALDAALRQRFGDGLRFDRPTGGMFVWASLGPQLAPGHDTSALLLRAVEHGVAFVPGGAFAVDPTVRRHDHGRSLRLSFATVDRSGLEVAVDRLADAFGAR